MCNIGNLKLYIVQVMRLKLIGESEQYVYSNISQLQVKLAIWWKFDLRKFSTQQYFDSTKYTSSQSLNGHLLSVGDLWSETTHAVMQSATNKTSVNITFIGTQLCILLI